MPRYSDKFKGTVKAEFEVGILSRKEICKKFKIPRKTLSEWSSKNGWVFEKNKPEVTTKVTSEVTKKVATAHTLKIIEREVNFYEKQVQNHLDDTIAIRTLTRNNLSAIESLEDKEEIDKVFASQKVIKIATETLDLAFKGQRLALGIKDEPAQTINIQNNTLTTDDIKKLPTNELRQRIAKLKDSRARLVNSRG